MRGAKVVVGCCSLFGGEEARSLTLEVQYRGSKDERGCGRVVLVAYC